MIIRRHACKLNTRSQRETYITDGKHASLGICLRGNTHPWETHHCDTGTVVTDGAGLVVTAEEDQILDDALETADKVVVVVTDVDGVVDILTHSTEKSSRLRTAVA